MYIRDPNKLRGGIPQELRVGDRVPLSAFLWQLDNLFTALLGGYWDEKFILYENTVKEGVLYCLSSEVTSLIPEASNH